MSDRSVRAVFTILVVVLALLSTAASNPVGAATEYQIQIDGSVDTPTREVSLRGATYNVSSIAKANVGDSLDVSIEGPDQLYRVYLYNADKQPVERRTGTGNATVTFDLSGLDAGTYMFAVQEQGTTQVIQPLVVKGYETTLQAPDTVMVGDSMEVGISLRKLSDNVSANRVEVVVVGQTTQITKSASKAGSTYTATLNTDDFSTGTYRIYANVRGDKVVYNQPEILGVSDSHGFRVKSSNTDSGSSGGSSQQTTETVVSTETADGPTGKIQTQTPTVEPTSTRRPDQSNDTSQASEQAHSPEPTTTGVITPTTQTETSTPTIPGFTFKLTGIASIICLIFIKSRL